MQFLLSLFGQVEESPLCVVRWAVAAMIAAGAFAYVLSHLGPATAIAG